MRLTNVITKPGEKTGRLTTSARVAVVDADTGVEFGSITEVMVDIRPNDIVQARLGLYLDQVQLEGVGASFVVAHPMTGERKVVSAIIFEDGERLDL